MRAWRQMDRASDAAAFTLVEVLVVISCLGLVVAILLPSAARVREMAWRTQCQANLRALGVAVHTHVVQVEFNGHLRPHYWALAGADGGIAGGWLLPMAGSTSAFRCPSDDGARTQPGNAFGGYVELSYTMNDDDNGFTSRRWSPRRITNPSRVLLLIEEHEALSGWNDAVAWQYKPDRQTRGDVPTQRHGGGGHLLFWDSSVRWIHLDAFVDRFPDYPNWQAE